MNKNKQLLLWQVTSVVLLLSILLYMFTSIPTSACVQEECRQSIASPVSLKVV